MKFPTLQSFPALNDPRIWRWTHCIPASPQSVLIKLLSENGPCCHWWRCFKIDPSPDANSCVDGVAAFTGEDDGKQLSGQSLNCYSLMMQSACNKEDCQRSEALMAMRANSLFSISLAYLHFNSFSRFRQGVAAREGPFVWRRRRQRRRSHLLIQVVGCWLWWCRVGTVDMTDDLFGLRSKQKRYVIWNLKNLKWPPFRILIGIWNRELEFFRNI